ncbi:MAG: glycerol-3-phosphate 1-O-acyltransferase PlsY [Rhizomicrobium sp.]
MPELTLSSMLPAAAIGYLFGSVPFGLIFAQLLGAGDVRKIGSGSIGATNVLRTGNYAAAALTLLFDALKGAAPVLIAQHYWGLDAALLAALGAFLGHLFPVWLGFKGGKGVAVSLGILLAIYWPIALLGFASWGAVLALSRISSLSALVAAVVTPIYMFLFHRLHETVLTVALAVLVIVIHHENIRRLLRGEEPRIGGRKSPATS